MRPGTVEGCRCAYCRCLLWPSERLGPAPEITAPALPWPMALTYTAALDDDPEVPPEYQRTYPALWVTVEVPDVERPGRNFHVYAGLPWTPETDEATTAEMVRTIISVLLVHETEEAILLPGGRRAFRPHERKRFGFLELVWTLGRPAEERT